MKIKNGMCEIWGQKGLHAHMVASLNFSQFDSQISSNGMKAIKYIFFGHQKKLKSPNKLFYHCGFIWNFEMYME